MCVYVCVCVCVCVHVCAGKVGEGEREAHLTWEMSGEFSGVDILVADEVDDFEQELASDALVGFRLAVSQGLGF